MFCTLGALAVGTPGVMIVGRSFVVMRSVFWDACPLADHEPRQGHEAGCGEKFLAQVVFDAAQHVFFGTQAVLDDLGESVL